MASVATWRDVTTAAPDLAKRVQARFEAHGLGLLATLRADGGPRISGIEPLFANGDLWLGMMDDARKLADLRRDPRLCLHNATVDKQVTEGDVKITGRGVEVADQAAFDAFVAGFEATTGNPPPPGPFPLFRVDVTEVVMILPAGDHLDIEFWTEAKGLQKVERY